MTDVIALTAAQAAAAVQSGELDRRELFEAYRERAAADELNAYLWVADEAPSANGGPLSGVPVAVKDLFCTEGVPSQAGSRILEGYRPPYTATSCAGWRRRAPRCWARPTRTSSRWVRRTRTPPTARRSTPGTAAACRVARRAAAPPPWPRAARRGLLEPTRVAPSASPPPCAASWASSPPTAP